ncbi:MAG: hypothetical protein QXW94_02920, partial [Desulfurococcaceae archaeon]
MSSSLKGRGFMVAAALAVAVGLAVGLIVWPPPAPRPIPRHVDPSAEADVLPLPRFMLLLVLKPLDDLVSYNFSGVSGELEALGNSYAPAGLRFLVDRFCTLMSRVAEDLNETDLLL